MQAKLPACVGRYVTVEAGVGVCVERECVCVLVRGVDGVRMAQCCKMLRETLSNLNFELKRTDSSYASSRQCWYSGEAVQRTDVQSS